MKTNITILLCLLVIGAVAIFVFTNSWFDLNPCPQGQTQIITVWTDMATGEQRTDKICMMKENEW
jgi:hypothetical protein